METTTPIRTAGHQQHLRRISLTAGPAAAAEARAEVRAAIFAWDLPVDESVAVLLTSELVTNAIMHVAGQTIALDICCAWGQLRVDVHDVSRSRPALVNAPADAEAGRGKAVYFALGFGAGTDGNHGCCARDSDGYAW
jgi:hypothetical protein